MDSFDFSVVVNFFTELYSVFQNKIVSIDYAAVFSALLEGMTFDLFIEILIIYFLVVWVALIIWVTKDIINRTNNIFLQIFSILTVLVLTPLWLFVYILIRPSKTLLEKYYEESELDDYVQEELVVGDAWEKLWTERCFECLHLIESEFVFCPNCRVKLKKECVDCSKEIKVAWAVCPYCGGEQDKKLNKKVEEVVKDEQPVKENETEKEEAKGDTPKPAKKS